MHLMPIHWTLAESIVKEAEKPYATYAFDKLLTNLNETVGLLKLSTDVKNHVSLRVNIRFLRAGIEFLNALIEAIGELRWLKDPDVIKIYIHKEKFSPLLLTTDELEASNLFVAIAPISEPKEVD